MLIAGLIINKPLQKVQRFNTIELMYKVNYALMKIWLFSIGGAIVSILLLLFGLKFLVMPNDAPDWQLLLLASVCIFFSVALMASKIYIPKKYKISALLVVLAFYFCARATGAIEGAWLMRILGMLSLIASGVIMYITYMAESKIRT